MLGVASGVASVTLPPAAAATGAVAPFFISRGGGGEGGAYQTSRCEFFDYQACLQAATGGANCVQNIDYHGDASKAPVAKRSHLRQ